MYFHFVKGDVMKEESAIVDAEIVDETGEAQSQADHQEPESGNDLKNKLLSAEHWLRFLFMVLFAAIAFVAAYVVTVLIVIQFLFALVTGESDKRLQNFGSSMSQYIFQILRFLTYNSEEKPFPFSDWPETELSGQDATDTAPGDQDGVNA